MNQRRDQDRGPRYEHERKPQTGRDLAYQIVSDELLRQIITGQDETAVIQLDMIARRIGEELGRRKFTTSQIRIVFSQMRTIEQETFGLQPNDNLPVEAFRPLRMLTPKLAYQYGRASGRDDFSSSKEEDRKKVAMGLLQTVLSDAIALVGTNQQYFHNLMDFFEAILAYHRYYGGKN